MVVIIDYNMGNVASVEKAFKALDVAAVVSHNKSDIEEAQYLVLPGVGAFGDGIKNLQALDLVDILHKKVVEDGVPFLGICLGMQLIAEVGYEFGAHKGLGWVAGEVAKLESKKLHLPHVGWNDVTVVKDDILFKDITDKNFYFVHSYFLNCVNASIVSATCEYGQRFAAAIRQDNIFATQFHPEKSQGSGLRLLQNFLSSRDYA